MKNFKVLVLLVAMLLLTTGCGKKLTCTTKEGDMEMKMVMSFKKDKLDKIKTSMSQEADSTDEAKEMVDEFNDSKDELPDSYKNVKVSRSGKKVTLTFDVDGKEYLSSQGIDDEEATYDYIKKDAEDSGYTCK